VSRQPTLEQLTTCFTKLVDDAEAFSGTTYRSCTPRYATETDLVTGEGSKLHGARWNPKGIAVVYAADSPETAMAESLAHFRYFSIPVHSAMPRVFVAIEMKLKRVVDLRESNVRQRLHVSNDTMTTIDWRKEVKAGLLPVTQAIGQAAFEAGVEGLIVPSAAQPEGFNVLAFPKNLKKGSKLQILNADSLGSP
jgi:RES domain-containing protein